MIARAAVILTVMGGSHREESVPVSGKVWPVNVAPLWRNSVSLSEEIQFVRSLMNDHTVEPCSGVIATFEFTAKWLLPRVLSLVLHQLMVRHQAYLTAWPVTLEAMH